MKKSTKALIAILAFGLIYSFYKLFTGQGGSGLYDFLDALVYTSIVLFLLALCVLLFNIKGYKQHWDSVFFLLLGLPLTISAVQGAIENYHYNRNPDLSVKYMRPVTKEQYLFDSINIKIAIDSLIVLNNKEHGGADVLYATIDTIIYSQTGDKIFVAYIEKFGPNTLGNDLDPNFLVADKRENLFWHLKESRYNMSGSFHDVESLKKEVRKFYFNKFSFLDRDILSKNYFWNVVL